MNTSAWQNRRVWIGGTAALAAIAVAAAWFLAISPKRSDASTTRAQTATVQAQNGVLAASNAALARQKSHLAGYQRQLVRALDALPGNGQLPEFSVAVTSVAALTHVDVKSISIGDQVAVDSATIAAAPTAASPSPAATTASATAAAVPAVASSSAASEYSIPVTIVVKGTAPADTAFVHALETGMRAASVTSAQLTSARHGVTMTVQVNIFTAPLSPEQLKEFKHLLLARG